ncbi:MAG: DUF4091 domain-containing protein [Verrucomicrobia bacterium]|nr:DUF4091 domain-containing protein [Verrucomicrobiota bacterium]
MDRLPLLLTLACAGLCTTGFSQTYATRFQAVENPLSEHGRWLNAGVDWTHLRVTNGVACGTQTGTNSGRDRFDDSYAHLAGFPPDQEAWGRASIAKPNPACHQELEILLRWTSSPHRTTGYECFARCVTGESAYVQIVRWDGPLGKFTYLADRRGADYGLQNGDVLKASIVGNVITVFINGVEKARVTDATFKTGNPGIGEFLGCDQGNGFASNADFGFSSFAARGIGGPLECVGASDLVRVFEDGYGSPAVWPTTLDVFGLRHETVSAQCVLLAHADLDRLTLSVGPLRQEGGTGLIPAENVRWNFVGGIFIEKNSPNRRPSSLSRAAPAWFPDVLTEDRQCALRTGARRAAYLTIKIPPGTPAGEYQARVTARAGDVSATLPLNLRVYPLDLPEERHLMVTEWFSTSEFRRHHHLEPSDRAGFFRLLKVYARNMADHRQNVFRVSLGLIEARRGDDGKLQFDFARFDEFAQVFWDTGRMDLLETGFVARFGDGGWSSREIVLDSFPVTEPDGRRTSMAGAEFLPRFLPALVAHLRAKGWLAKTLFHICDEPSDHNVMAWRQASELVRRRAPELRRIDAIETPHCLNDLEIWVPKLDHLATWYGAYHEAQRRGAELWFYTVGIYQGGDLLNKTVDVPLLETRLMPWLNYRFHLRGYLHWGFNAWTDDPLRAPGPHRGDGWHVYPKSDGLLDSLRWEQMRNGIEDYECLWLLENQTAQIQATLAPRVAALINPRQRGVEIASQVVADFQEHTRRPDVLYAARRQVVEETLALGSAPRVLLQTIPLEHSPVARGCVIEVHGWAEPGTVMTANDQPVPVAADGLFLAQIAPAADGRIVVEARRERGAKRLVRQFAEPTP